MYNKDSEFYIGKIKSIVPIGIRDVYDIEVENDHSYLAQGFINHNSAKEPNPMQIPSKLRHLIIARPGKKILSLDYSQFEFRAAAAATEEEVLIEAFSERARLLPEVKAIADHYGYVDADTFTKDVAAGKIEVTSGEKEVVHEFAATDIHKRNASLIFNKDVDEITSGDRSVAKCVSLDSYIHTEAGICKLRSLLPKKLKAGTYYDLGINILTDVGMKPAPKVFYHGKADGFRIKTRLGAELICSGIHKFRSVNAKGQYVWVKASSLKPGRVVFQKFTKTLGKGHKNSKAYSLLGLMLKYGIPVSDKIFMPLSTLDRVQKIAQEGKLKVDIITSKKEPVYQISWDKLPSLEEIPEEFISNISVEQFRLLLQEVFDYTPTLRLRCQSKTILRQLRNLFTRIGFASFANMPSYDVSGLWTLSFGSATEQHILQFLEKGTLYEYPEVYARKLFGLEDYHFLLHEKGHVGSSTAVIDKKDTKDIHELLGKQMVETSQFLYENLLYRDYIVSIDPVRNIDMGDVSVPDNSTVVYEGLVTHNTLGYAVLYGAGADRIQQSLAKEKYYYTPKECREFLETFFERLPKMKRFIEDTHTEVLKDMNIPTHLGRKRFFVLPPKYLTRRYETERESAFREAVNHKFQGANADATKIAMVEADRVFQKYPEAIRPIIILSVHDEIVIEVDESVLEEVKDLMQKIMVESGMRATGYKVAIEVSTAHGSEWAK